MLVPALRSVPPPRLSERIPCEPKIHEVPDFVRVSRSSPGAEMVTPVPVTGSNRPSVVNLEAMSAGAAV